MNLLISLFVTLFVLLPFAHSSSKEEIRQKVRSNLTEFQKCYESARKENPDLHGKIVMNWKINDQGDVSDASVDHEKSSFKNDDFNQCMITTLKKIEFTPAPKGELKSISFPFVFSARSARD